MKRRILTILFAAMVMFANWVPSTLAQAEETNEMSEGENDMASSVYTGAGSTYSAKDYYEDTEKPVVNAVQLKKGDDILKKEDVLVPGEKVHISVQATDNVGFGGATVNFQTGGTASASIENVRKTVNLTYQEDSQSFEGDMEITDVMLSGNWIISEVCVYDTSYNTTYLYYNTIGDDNKIKDLGFIIQNDIGDIEAPKLTAIKLKWNGNVLQENDILALGDKVQISIQATDNKGLDKAEIIFKTDDNKSSVLSTNTEKRMEFNYQFDTQSFEGSLDITGEMYPGLWYISYLKIWDTSGNSKTYSISDIDKTWAENGSFIFENSDFDTEAPVIKSVSMEKSGENVRSGDSIMISAVVTDNEKIEAVEVSVQAAETAAAKSETIVLTRVGDSDTYQGFFNITDSTYPCEWYLSYIIASDISGNKTQESRISNSTLQYAYYVNVNDGDTFIDTTYNVSLYYINEDGEIDMRLITVPRRTKINDIDAFFVPESYPELEFQGWRLSLDNEKNDEGILSNYSRIYAKYDKIMVSFGLDILDNNGEFLKSVNIKKVFVDPGTKVEIPWQVQGYKDIIWYYDKEDAIAPSVGTIVAEDNLYGWIHYSGEAQEELEYLKFSSASLTLQNDLTINYKVEKSLFDDSGYADPYVVFSRNGIETKVTEYTVVGSNYVFDFTDIAPHQLNDTIYATLYAEFDGTVYSSETKEYSVAEYCYNMLDKYSGNEYAKLRTLLVDLLNYGAASQVYTDYNKDNLVNAALTQEQIVWGTSENSTIETVMDNEYSVIDSPAVIWKGAGLNLQESVTLRFKIAAENTENLRVKVISESGDEWIINSNSFEAINDGYYVFFDGLNAGQMRETIYVTVYDGDIAVSNTIRYSIESYAYSKRDDSNEKLNKLLNAMMKYGDSAYSYIN